MRIHALLSCCITAVKMKHFQLGIDLRSWNFNFVISFQNLFLTVDVTCRKSFLADWLILCEGIIPLKSSCSRFLMWTKYFKIIYSKQDMQQWKKITAWAQFHQRFVIKYDGPFNFHSNWIHSVPSTHYIHFCSIQCQTSDSFTDRIL